MSRIMKFRFWDGEQINLPCQLYTMTLDGIIEYDGGSVGVSQHPEYEVMQYTGLKDKNGVEIYEGDVLETYYEDDEDSPYIIEVKTMGTVPFCGEVYGLDYDHTPIGFFVDLEIEIKVIGNIYSNPELLEN